MNSIIVVGIALILFWLGYKFYAARLERLFDVDPRHSTPAVSKFDGIDYVPAKHWLILFGHHFASIAGAGPIIGPVIGCILWGWFPALIWVVFGTILIGGVHDFSALIISVREGGSSIADIASGTISKKAKVIFGIFVWLALILVIAVFIRLCAKTFVDEPKIALPSLGLIPLAVFLGYLLYNRKVNIVLATIFCLVILAGLIFLGEYFPISLGWQTLLSWSMILIIYSFIASIMPVQILLQPRDYLSSFLLFFGLLFGFIGLFILHPNINLPITLRWNTDSGWLWPMMCVTIACGAISGFHSLISSGTSSKQLPNERYAKRIGYGGMVAEGALAVLAIMAVVAGLAQSQDIRLALAKSGPIGVFGMGYAIITNKILGKFGFFVAVTILNAFILTTLDTATRITRYITSELFNITNRYLSTSIVLLFAGALALSGKWSKIWPAFGASNQLVAALALLVATCWLLSHKKAFLYTLIPAMFMLATSLVALIWQILNYILEKDYTLLSISVILVVLAIYMLFESLKTIGKNR